MDYALYDRHVRVRYEVDGCSDYVPIHLGDVKEILERDGRIGVEQFIAEEIEFEAGDEDDLYYCMYDIMQELYEDAGELLEGLLDD